MTKSKSKKNDASPYSTKGFAQALDQAGTSEEVAAFLEEEGMQDGVQKAKKPSGKKTKKKAAKNTKKVAKRTTKKAAARASSRRATSKKTKISTKTQTPPPRRKKGRSPFKNRSFRLPLETDDQLQFLKEHYSCYMIDVIKSAIHNEWVKVIKERRRRNRDDSEESEARVSGGEESTDASTESVNDQCVQQDGKSPEEE